MSPNLAGPGPDWPDDALVLRLWPALERIVGRELWGSGVKLATPHGPAHLKRRPPANIHAEIWVLDQLDQRGVPVTVPVPSITGAPQQMVGDLAYLVYRELPGLPRNDYWAPDMLEAMRAVGAACAQLHQSMAMLDAASAVVLGLHVRRQTRGCEGLPVQIIHRDFHAGNVLFEDNAITGYLDFDHVELGPRLVDLTYATGSAMARLHESGHAGGWLEVWQAMVAGYDSVWPLTDAEIKQAPDVLVGIEQDFATWFADIGDQDNEQFSLLLADDALTHADQMRDRARTVTR